LHDGKVFTSGNVENVCRTLCPSTYRFSTNSLSDLPRLLQLCRNCFPECRVGKYHEQVSVSGRSVDPQRLVMACGEAQLDGIEFIEAPSSLPDAMSFHLSQNAQPAE
ncbi:MAG: hypothetical protein KDD66_17095, partial [Bdellovibrionales bacterium]|nr:hypothetical protein [Bdellovibrionales bacterium]